MLGSLHPPHSVMLLSPRILIDEFHQYGLSRVKFAVELEIILRPLVPGTRISLHSSIRSIHPDFTVLLIESLPVFFGFYLFFPLASLRIGTDFASPAGCALQRAVLQVLRRHCTSISQFLAFCAISDARNNRQGTQIVTGVDKICSVVQSTNRTPII